jgi:hypothetical protein
MRTTWLGCAAMPSVLLVQGRWWCANCKRLYTGCVEVASYDAEVCEIRHTCGAVMVRTPGDERAD